MLNGYAGYHQQNGLYEEVDLHLDELQSNHLLNSIEGM